MCEWPTTLDNSGELLWCKDSVNTTLHLKIDIHTNVAITLEAHRCYTKSMRCNLFDILIAQAMQTSRGIIVSLEVA